jgi:hypothetical protein
LAYVTAMTTIKALRLAAITASHLTFLTPALAQAKTRSHPHANFLNPARWFIGPVVSGQNASHGMPLHPEGAGGGWYFDLPPPPGSVHYITFRHGSLTGKTRIVMRYRVEVNPGVRIEPVTAPGSPSIITLYFQRAGDDWSGADEFETYRWYATFASQSPITPGEHLMVASLKANWTAIQSSSRQSNPMAFRDAITHADQVGFVLGGGTGYGHGIYATGGARITVEDFEVQ